MTLLATPAHGSFLTASASANPAGDSQQFGGKLSEMLEDLPDGFWHALLLLLPDNDALQLSRVSRTLRRRVSSAPALNAGVTVGLSTLEVRQAETGKDCWTAASMSALLSPAKVTVRLVNT